MTTTAPRIGVRTGGKANLGSKSRGGQHRQFNPKDADRLHAATFHSPSCIEARTYISGDCDCEGKPNHPASELITLYSGERGQGKSLSAVAEATDQYIAGVPVLHNKALHFGQEWDFMAFTRNRYFTSTLIIDEVEEYFNSLRVNLGSQVDAVGTIIQLRHQGCEILATTQYPDEINRRFLRRVDWWVICHSRDEGRTVHQTWIYKPWHKNHPRSGRKHKRVLLNGWSYFEMYDHRRYVVVGHGRKTAADRRADDEIDAKQLVFSLLVQAALQGQNRINATAVQMAARQEDAEFSRSEKVVERWLKQFPGMEYIPRSPDRAFTIPKSYKDYAEETA